MSNNIKDQAKQESAKVIADIDSVETSKEHKRIIQSKKYLKNIYCEIYDDFKKVKELSPGGRILELGSGGGFLKEVLPQTITSDVVKFDGIDEVISAEELPFNNNSLAVIFMVNVFHHIKDVSNFLSEAERCLIPGGKVFMIEPANTLLSSFIYSNFHSEPFDRKSNWKIESEGRLSSSNQALPWIVFKRDKKIFNEKYKSLKINMFSPYMPLRYIISGGLSMKQLLPDSSYGVISGLEKMISPLNGLLGLFYKIEVEKA